ncbi:MAG: methylenetetrahydrofolate reductase [Bacteroidia bacterium]|nr:methylenetetrahydrofolate reductase [Bacteroidia bacterium]MDW8157581.1 methylenetetrahydrofolate reductase [Bacteroidia bacterium]
MKVIEHIANAKKPLISLEIIPPKRGGNILQIYKAIESILPYAPPFINVTSHSAEVMWEEMKDGTFRRIVKRKSPGTFGLCAAIKYKYNIDPVPHLLCAGFTREETEDALIELNYLGVENLLAIRGDIKYEKPIPDGRSVNRYALDLVKQITDMNNGKYLDDLIDVQPTDFCVGVAAYPEKHFESPNLAFDIDVLKKKQDAGAHYAICQMFFNNAHYYNYVQRARKAGITIPIIPGLKIITSKSQVMRLPKAFHIEIPEELVNAILNASSDKEAKEIGIQWAYKQAVDLLENGVNILHFYIMQNTETFLEVINRLKKDYSL